MKEINLSNTMFDEDKWNLSFSKRGGEDVVFQLLGTDSGRFISMHFWIHNVVRTSYSDK